MTGRTLLYGVDGRTPILTDKTISEEMTEVLVEAFGFCTGLLVAHAKDPQQMALLMDESRQKIIKGVLMLEDLRPAIEARFHVRITLTPDGQLMVSSDEVLERPPGSPVNPYGA